MKKLLEQFLAELTNQGKSPNTVSSYSQHINGYIKWFEQTKHMTLTTIHEDNVKEYTHYLKIEKGNKPTSIHPKVVAITKFSEFLIDMGIESEVVRPKKVQVKVQKQNASLTTITKDNVEHFRQSVLDTGNYRNYAIVTLMAYAGLRISEALALKVSDINLTTQEIHVLGKGDKYRTVMIGYKVKSVLEKYLNEFHAGGDTLFESRQGGTINRTVINKLFNKYSTNQTLVDKVEKGKSKKSESSQKVDIFTFTQDTPDLPSVSGNFEFAPMTPHDLRHFFCTNAFEVGYEIHEVANQAGHTSINTTMRYLNPTKKQILSKADLL